MTWAGCPQWGTSGLILLDIGVITVMWITVDYINMCLDGQQRVKVKYGQLYVKRFIKSLTLKIC